MSKVIRWSDDVRYAVYNKMVELQPGYMSRWANGVNGVWRMETNLVDLFRKAQTELIKAGKLYMKMRRHAPSGQSEFELIAEVVAASPLPDDPFRLLVKPVAYKTVPKDELKTIKGSAPFVPGYHTKPIAKGVLGELSKVREELDEALDAAEQGVKLMVLVELSDMVGAIESYLDKHFPDLTFVDLVKMKDVTKRAFKNGRRQ